MSEVNSLATLGAFLGLTHCSMSSFRSLSEIVGLFSSFSKMDCVGASS